MSKTKAELQQELDALQEQVEALRASKSANRARYGYPIWESKNRPTAGHPAWYGAAVRVVVPEGLKAGDPLWIDSSYWPFDEETSPVHYEPGKEPVMNGSLSPCPANLAKDLEKRHQEYLAQRAGR